MSTSEASSSPPQAAEQKRWFADDVYSHDVSLRSYINGSFPTVREDVDDLVQESYLRLWKARAVQPIRSARGLLFRIARNLAVDLIRHTRCSPIDQGRSHEMEMVLDDRSDAAESAERTERIALLADAIAELPRRCREIFILHKIKGYSRKEVAAQLGLSDRTVGMQTERAVKRCVAYLRKRGVNGGITNERP